MAAELTATTRDPVHSQEDTLGIDIGQKEETKAGDGADAAEADPKSEEKRSCCPPWLFSYTASYVAGIVVWTALITMVAINLSKLHGEDDDGTDDSYSNATICDAAPLDGLAAHFFDESCVEALTCDDQAMLYLFMYEFLAPLRVEMVSFFQCYLLVNFMVVQQGGIPSTTKDDGKNTRWNLGCFAWSLWVSCVSFQWVTNLSSAASLTFSYISMEAKFRPCMVELESGDALLNMTLPVMLFHPVLLAQLINTLSLAHAILTALFVAGVKLDPRAWLLRYAVAMLGPYFTFGMGYFLVTLSFVFAYVFFLPLFLFGAVLTTALCLLLFKLIMPWLKGKEQDDQEAFAKYEKDIQEAAGEGCLSWCNGRWATLWCGNAVCGLPRFARAQLREVLWWFDAGEPDKDEDVLDDDAKPGWFDVIIFGIFSPVGAFRFISFKNDEDRNKSVKTFTDLNDMMRVAVLALTTITLSPFIICSTWSAFYAYQGIGNDASMEFIADVYHHTFAIFTGSVELPALDFDFTVLWKDAWYDFVAMWDFVKLAPDKLLAISKTLNGAGFGFGLSKVLVSAGTAGVFAFLQLFPDNWELIGGRNVPLGGSAKGHTDPGAFLENLNRMDNDVMSSFNVDFGPIIKEGEDGKYVFSGEEATNKDLFHFDLSILARVFGEKLKGLNLRGLRGMQGNLESLPKSVTNLNLAQTNFEGDIESLKDCPLQTLDLSYCSKLTGNIKDLPQSITDFNLTNCKSLTGDIESLKDMPLTLLNLRECTKLKGDIESLKDCPLQKLDLTWCRELTGNIEVFKDMNIKSLNLEGCRGLQGNLESVPKSVINLNLAHTKIEGDIESLKDCPLQVLNLSGSEYNPSKFTGDIESLKDCPLQTLDLYYCEQLAGDITPQMLDWLSGIKTKDLKRTMFTLTPQTFLMLLEGRADFTFFDTLYLPSQETIKQAPPDVVNSLNAITEVDLTREKVGFNVAGNIKDLPQSITDLNLEGCKKLEGNIKNLPQSITDLNLAFCEKLEGNLESLPKSVTNLNLASTNIEGNIKDLPQSITDLNLFGCERLRGKDKAKEMFPNAKVQV